MQRTLALVALLGLAFAGCIGSDTPSDSTNGGSSNVQLATPPAPISDTKTVSGSADPLNTATGVPCNHQAAGCFQYPFELMGNTTVDAKLSWTLPPSDFDLYLVQGERQITFSAGQPPGTTEAIKRDMAAGSYAFVVAAWAVAQDTYTFTVDFTALP